MGRVFGFLLLLVAGNTSADLMDRVTHHYADNDGTKIHYVTTGAERGAAPLVVMIHGFPDFWYSWREQMIALEDRFRVVAIDQRGYNKSDQPDGVAAYAMPNLIADVAAVIANEGEEQAVIVGHDWGGAVSWSLAMSRPELVQYLIILNLPHPNGMSREIRNNPEQRANSEYAFRFQQPDAHKSLSAEGLAGWVADEDARPRYVEAFGRSSFEGMLNFYKANYPRPPEPGTEPPPSPPLPKVKMPVLMFHGLEDTALLHTGLNGTWEWLEQDLTLVTVPGAGHFVQQDASELVSATMRSWLLQRFPND